MPRPSQSLLAATVTALGLAGCGGSTADETTPAPSASVSTAAPTTAKSGEAPPDEGGPLTSLPDCEDPPQAVPADVPGLVLPDESAVVTSVQEDGPLVTVEGYVELTPIQVRRSYQEIQGLDVFQTEDEVFEAEVMYGQGEFRSYAKATATCKTGSALVVVVGPAGDTN